MRLYLDACCLNRLTDDQSQPRVRQEAEVVERILRLVREARVTWVSSAVLEVEISRNPDADRRRDVGALLSFVDEEIVPGPKEAVRALDLQRLGHGAFDALHLACAERGGVDVFLTTDDGLLRRSRRHPGAIPARCTFAWRIRYPGGRRVCHDPCRTDE
ncbi:MAG: PIN domain-containing protein [Acidobacteria bacterium]|nr:PIN domain-containing protein [Acidobacteriota bacterium]